MSPGKRTEKRVSPTRSRSHYFLDTTARQRRAVDDELARLRDLVGETRFSVRFPGLIQKALLA